MIIGLILLGMIGGTTLGLTALLSGASIGMALAIYACFGSAVVLGAAAVLYVKSGLSENHQTKQMSTQFQN